MAAAANLRLFISASWVFPVERLGLSLANEQAACKHEKRIGFQCSHSPGLQRYLGEHADVVSGTACPCIKYDFIRTGNGNVVSGFQSTSSGIEIVNARFCQKITRSQVVGGSDDCENMRIEFYSAENILSRSGSKKT